MENQMTTKTKILENAKDLLEKNGLKGLTVQNLIEKCSIGKTTFYKLFPTKKDLLLQLKYFSNNDNIRVSNIKDQIAEIAKEGFSKYGFSHLDMDTIARAAKLNRVTLYRYFSSKDELLEYCIQSEFNNIKKHLSELINDLDNPVITLRKCFNLLISLNKISSGHSLVSETWNQIHRNEKIREYTRDLHLNFFNTYKEILDAGKQKGIFKIDMDTSLFIEIILVIQKGILFTLSFESEFNSFETVLDTMLNLVLKEIKQP